MTLVALASGRAVRALRPLARARRPLRAATALRSAATRPAFLDAKEPLPASYDFGVEGPLYEWWEASGKFKPQESENQSNGASAAPTCLPAALPDPTSSSPRQGPFCLALRVRDQEAAQVE